MSDLKLLPFNRECLLLIVQKALCCCLSLGPHFQQPFSGCVPDQHADQESHYQNNQTNGQISDPSSVDVAQRGFQLPIQ